MKDYVEGVIDACKCMCSGCRRGLEIRSGQDIQGGRLRHFEKDGSSVMHCAAEPARALLASPRAMQCPSCHSWSHASDTIVCCWLDEGHEGLHIDRTKGMWRDGDPGTGTTRMECLLS